ncbi:prefoldin subunit 3-like isoform X1 [Crassostrea virginica]
MATNTSTPVQNSDTKGALGIPRAEFVEDVDSYMKRDGNDSAEAVLKRLDESHNKYKFMEYNLTTKKARLKAQIPDIKTSLDIVKHLQSRKDSTDPMETRFLLSDQVYAKARIPPTDKVNLWLGANVMLEYGIEDAYVCIMMSLYQANFMLENGIEDAYVCIMMSLYQASVMLEYGIEDAYVCIMMSLYQANFMLENGIEDAYVCIMMSLYQANVMLEYGIEDAYVCIMMSLYQANVMLE